MALSREQVMFAFSMMADLSAGQLGPEIDVEVPLASHFSDLLTTFEAWWSNLATWQKLEPEQQRGLIQTIEKAYGGKVEMLRAARDRRLSAILRALEQSRTT